MNSSDELRIFLLVFFNDTATTEIYTLSLHDALPICLEQVHAWRAELRRDVRPSPLPAALRGRDGVAVLAVLLALLDRKSTRLNSSHANISYAVFCLKKKHIFYP